MSATPIKENSQLSKEQKASLDKESSSLKRSERKSKCSEESIASYRKGSFEEALELFAEYAALIESESIVQEGGDGASARAPSPAPASMASEAMAFLHRVFGAAPQVGCSGRRSAADLFAT